MKIFVAMFIGKKKKSLMYITITRLLTAMLLFGGCKNGDFQMKNLMKIVLTSTHNIYFEQKRKSFTPENITFSNIKWDLQRCSYPRLVKR